MSRLRQASSNSAPIPKPSAQWVADLTNWWRKATSHKNPVDKIKPSELTFILQTLSTLVSNGVPLPKALGTLSREDTIARHRDLLDSLRRKVESGVSFSAALKHYPQVCDHLTVSQIRLGEKSGTLAETLQHLSENRSRSSELRQAIIKKLAYPCLLVALGSGLLTFLMMYVVPVFQETYDKAHVPLPLITRWLIQCSEIVKSAGMYVVLIFLLVGIAVPQLRKRKTFALAIDREVLKIPYLGSWLRDIAILQVMEVLNSLMSAGYTLAEAVRETAPSVKNRCVQEGVHALHAAIQRGERFSRELERLEEMFPPIVNQLVIVGESTGQLTRATQDICIYLRREIERKTTMIVGALEPILTIGLAAAIALVLLAIYLPMFDMVNTIGG